MFVSRQIFADDILLPLFSRNPREVGDCFARITVPLYEETHPFPETLPWFRLPRHRSQVHAALEQRPGVGWVVLSLLEDAGIAEGLKPRRTDDIVAAESGRSVPSSSTQLDAWLRGSEARPGGRLQSLDVSFRSAGSLKS
eukprot:s1758_g10.t1